MDEPILVPHHQKLPDKTINKPVYLVISESFESKSKLSFFKTTNLTKQSMWIEIRGFEITKTQADNLKENPYAKETGETEINIDIPWSQVKRIVNVTYKQQGKQNVK